MTDVAFPELVVNAETDPGFDFPTILVQFGHDGNIDKIDTDTIPILLDPELPSISDNPVSAAFITPISTTSTTVATLDVIAIGRTHASQSQSPIKKRYIPEHSPWLMPAGLGDQI